MTINQVKYLGPSPDSCALSGKRRSTTGSTRRVSTMDAGGGSGRVRSAHVSFVAVVGDGSPIQ